MYDWTEKVSLLEWNSVIPLIQKSEICMHSTKHNLSEVHTKHKYGSEFDEDT